MRSIFPAGYCLGRRRRLLFQPRMSPYTQRYNHRTSLGILCNCCADNCNTDQNWSYVERRRCLSHQTQTSRYTPRCNREMSRDTPYTCPGLGLGTYSTGRSSY